MLWKVLHDAELGCSSYIVGDESTGQVGVIDPLGKLGAAEYLLEAQDLGATIAFVAETHVHADHLSCAQELAHAAGAPHILSHEAPAAFPFQAVREGETLEIGHVSLGVWETPGHTRDSLSFLVTDHARSADAWAVLTGDSLFVGDVGRPDLVNADDAAILEAARTQHASVQRLASLPDFTEIWPAHYGSSPCGGLFMSKKPSSTIGYEKRNNRFLHLRDAEAFARSTLRLLKPPPEDAGRIRSANLGQAIQVASDA